MYTDASCSLPYSYLNSKSKSFEARGIYFRILYGLTVCACSDSILGCMKIDFIKGL